MANTIHTIEEGIPYINRWNIPGMALTNYGKLLEHFDGNRRYFHKVQGREGTIFMVSDQRHGALTINELVKQLELTITGRLTIKQSCLVIHDYKEHMLVIPYTNNPYNLPNGYHEINRY